MNAIVDNLIDQLSAACKEHGVVSLAFYGDGDTCAVMAQGNGAEICRVVTSVYIADESVQPILDQGMFVGIQHLEKKPQP